MKLCYLEQQQHKKWTTMDFPTKLSSPLTYIKTHQGPFDGIRLHNCYYVNIMPI